MSVVVATYNGGRYLAQALRSALDQDGVDKEILVVDDGSTDDTRRVLEPFLGAVRYLYSENRGPAHARNLGMKASSGRYIAFLDSDDLYLPGKLALQTAFLDAHPEVGFVSTDMSAMKGDVVLEESHLKSYHRVFGRKGWCYEDLYPVSGEFRPDGSDRAIPYRVGSIFRQSLQGQVLITNTVLFRREILETVGYQNEAYRTGEDYEYLVRICRRCSAAFLDVPTYLYRYHDRQITGVGSGYGGDRLRKEIAIEEVFLKTVLDWGYGDKDYYRENRGWIDYRISELHGTLGKKWMEMGNKEKAREHFRAGRGFDPSNPVHARGILLSRLPDIVRRGVEGIARRWKERAC